MQIVSIIFIIFVIFIWACSWIAVIDKWFKNDVPTNILSVLILLCPVINTLLALYYGYPEFKEI